MSADRVLVVAVDDSDDSQKAFEWAVKNIHRPGDELHLVHVIPRLQFAAMLGVPPVDFVPAAANNNYETVVQRAEHFIIERFVKTLPAGFSSPPVVHIIKVRSGQYLGSGEATAMYPCQGQLGARMPCSAAVLVTAP
jgi:nucleotide-binding universal stress UspA family protein